MPDPASVLRQSRVILLTLVGMAVAGCARWDAATSGLPVELSPASAVRHERPRDRTDQTAEDELQGLGEFRGAGREWSGFRGGLLEGVASDERLPVHWDLQRGVRWSARLAGTGSASPVVWGDRVFLLLEVPARRLALACYDLDSGQLVWQRDLGAAKGRAHHKNGFASATVVTDGRSVFASCGAAGLFCFDVDGHWIWHVPLEPVDHQWGLASSPVLHGDLVFQLCDGENAAFLAAFHKTDGRLAWRVARQSHGCWTTPVLVPVVNGERVRWELVVNGTGSQDGSAGYVIAYEPETGRELWRVRGTTDIPCPAAIVGQGLVISSSGNNGPLLAIRAGGEGDVTASQTVWRQPSGGPYVPTGVIYQNRLYVLSDGGLISCRALDDGSLVWQQRLRGTYSASLIAGAGQVYAVSEQGDVHVLAAGDSFRLEATNRLRQRCLATPAVANGQLLIRTDTHLHCIVGEDSIAWTANTDGPSESPTAVSPSDLPADDPSDLISDDPSDLILEETDLQPGVTRDAP
jgi:outer membrane protein assembly factor BamB